MQLPELATRMSRSNVSVIKEMMYLGAQEEQKGRDIVSLGVGIPFYPAPKHIHEHVIKQLAQKPNIDKYTLLIGLPKLRELIADISTRDLGLPVTSGEILVTPGSMAALFYAALTIVDDGDEVILPSPYFSSYAEQVGLAGGIPVPVSLKTDENKRLRLDVPAIERAITNKTKAIIINSPSNPTGAVFLESDLRDLSRILVEKKIYVITDEVYDYLIYTQTPYFNVASIKELWPRVIRCCSLSKKYGMMGWRVGYLHTNKDLLMHLLKIHDAAIVCAPHISQEAAIAAFSGPQDVVTHHKELLDQNRILIEKRMQELSDLFSYTAIEGTYYAFPEYHMDVNSIEMAKNLLYQAGVVTVPGIGFGPDGEHHLRLSFGSPASDIEKAFDRIKQWWHKQK